MHEIIIYCGVFFLILLFEFEFENEFQLNSFASKWNCTKVQKSFFHFRAVSFFVPLVTAMEVLATGVTARPKVDESSTMQQNCQHEPIKNVATGINIASAVKSITVSKSIVKRKPNGVFQLNGILWVVFFFCCCCGESI